MDQKIGEQHLARKAILYVRQSSAHQVARNGESRKLQYGMESRFGRRLKSWTRTWASRHPGRSIAVGSRGWWPKFALAKSVP